MPQPNAAIPSFYRRKGNDKSSVAAKRPSEKSFCVRMICCSFAIDG
ncbi:hypothetical protein NEIELOOT_01559 [Neisseria elongata subsp. glycolytica ATCC 29315]|uniref:Uncharacterized protein n=1 Tax=Neisseria elongata subsp. glycolytica ATCC 29315 TaxID=546263 RepID=D4DR66_NEIEG|nr:hypothetical protein NEIELOOT_01559 [Neisseria elongata subsp. glycolytica ATCC 29315]